MKSIVAVASGKGGVGKSTIAANLAVALANNEPTKKVALIDLDFYGPSVPTLMGGGKLAIDPQEKFIPPMQHGVKYISIAFFLQNDDDPVVWRGPMFGKAIAQLFQDTSWGEVDIAVIDMPPGTGDAQLSLSQMIKLDGALMVTTPQEVALADVRRAINMFAKVNVPVLGLVENMAGFVTPSGETVDIFGAGGGEELSKRYDIPLLGSIPLTIAIREGGDKGQPIALDIETSTGQLFAGIAERVVQQIESSKEAAPSLSVVN